MFISLVGGLVAFSVVLRLSCRQALCFWILGLPQWFFPTPSCRFGPTGISSIPLSGVEGLVLFPSPNFFHQTSFRSFYSALGIWSFFPPSNSLNLLFHRRHKGKLSVLHPIALATPDLYHKGHIFRTLADFFCEHLVLRRKVCDECKFSIFFFPVCWPVAIHWVIKLNFHLWQIASVPCKQVLMS